MKILADENIPYVTDAFRSLGEVVIAPGRTMTPALLKDTEMLLVRSVTKVNESLLKECPVRFVATATIGEDHIDRKYLRERGIAFAGAPGSNANSVAEYMVAALLVLAERHRFHLEGMTLGIVGVGNVGSRVLAKAESLGLKCVLNDPPLARQTGDPRYRPIEQIFECDIVTLHVPLTNAAPDRTYHLANDDFLAKMKPGSIVINTSRGAVVETTSLLKALQTGRLKACVLDVWENEPNINRELLRRVDLGTAHIAGYSFDGKVNGTRMIYEAACRFLNQTPTWDPSSVLPAPECPRLVVDGKSADIEAEVRKAVLTVYDIRRDDQALRSVLSEPADQCPAIFDRLRKQYPRRREFFNTRTVVEPPNSRLEEILRGLGFHSESNK